MILRKPYDPKKPYKFVRYLRMSTHSQNKRSPEQQADTIDRVLRQLDYPWKLVRDYRDDGISGKLIRKRPGFSQMIHDIKLGIYDVDLILVDTFERYGRNDELEALRTSMARHYGVLLLTADTSFADPTTFTGKILGSFESGRATEDNRIKAHNVARGRRDAVLLGHWPGGPVPTGYKLKQFFVEVRGLTKLDYSILIPDSDTSWIIKMVYSLAHQSGWGSTRIARYLNSLPGVIQQFGKVSSQTVNRWLSNWIYVGVFRYDQLEIQVVDDVRVQSRNDEEDWTVNERFCEPLIERDVFDQVQHQRAPRSNRGKKAKSTSKPFVTKLLQVIRPGGSIKYPLSGLVICAHCGRSMVPHSSTYVTKSGNSKRYVTYDCPARHDNLCPNRCSVKADWLLDRVVSQLRLRLFQVPAEQVLSVSDIHMQPWYSELRDKVIKTFERLELEKVEQVPVLESRIKELEKQQRGRRITLSNPDIDDGLRRDIMDEYGVTTNELKELDSKLQGLLQSRQRLDAICDDHAIVQRLNKLNEIFGMDNPTRAGLELSLHIDSIRCHVDGKVVIRTCKLGALAEVRDLLHGHELMKVELASPAEKDVIQARRRTIRQVNPSEDEDEVELYNIAFDAADPHRYDYLPAEWFWEDVYQKPEPSCWSKDFAEEVAAMKLSTGWPTSRLAEHYGKSIPTVRLALNNAKAKMTQECKIAS